MEAMPHLVEMHKKHADKGLVVITVSLDPLDKKDLVKQANDFLRKLGDEQTKRNVRAMVKVATDNGISVVLMATPKPGLIVTTPEFYKEIASEFAIPFDDVTLRKVLSNNELKSDLVHPNSKGYSQIAEAFATLLMRAGAV